MEENNDVESMCSDLSRKKILVKKSKKIPKPEITMETGSDINSSKELPDITETSVDANDTPVQNNIVEKSKEDQESKNPGDQKDNIKQKSQKKREKKKLDGDVKPRVAYYYHDDISDIPSYINSMVKFMGIHPEFFKTNVSKKMIYLHENQIFNVYETPVHFKDTIHNVKGYISTEYNTTTKQYKMVISVKTTLTKSEIDYCYAKKIEQYVLKQAKHGDHIELQYNKILTDTIIKHCYYSQPIKQWEEDVKILKEEFFLPSKNGLLSIMNNKVNNDKIGSITNSWNNLILYGKPGTGKCLAKDTEVIMFNGDIKKIQDVNQYDLVMGDDSTYRVVMSTNTGESEMFEVTYYKNADIDQIVPNNSSNSPKRKIYNKYTVNDEHILSLCFTAGKNILHNKNECYYQVSWFEDNEIETLKFSYMDKQRQDAFHSRTSSYSSSYNSNNMELDEITDNSDLLLMSQYDAYMDAKEILLANNPYINISVKEYLSLSDEVQSQLKGYTTSVNFNCGSFSKEDLVYVSNNYQSMQSLPKSLKAGSLDNRMSFINNILEHSDLLFKHESSATFYIEHQYKSMIKDLIFICRSLGFEVEEDESQTENEEENMHSFIVRTFDIESMTDIVEEINHSFYDRPIINYYDVELISKGVDKYYGFELDGNHKFVLGTCAVTHNSSFIYRISMILKMSILSIDLSLYLNKKKELYALLHGQEFCLPNSSEKQPAMSNVIIALEEFDTAIEHILDIENVFAYKEVLKRRYLDMKNNELKEKAVTMIEEDHNEATIQKIKKTYKIGEPDDKILKTKRDEVDEDYDSFMNKMMLEDGIDIKNNKVFDKARMNILERREHDNEMHSINAELNNIIKSMDEDNKSNILRMNDLLELFSPAIPVQGRIIIGTTNHLEKMREKFPALFRAGRMTNVEFSYLDWPSANQLSKYYFDAPFTLDPFEITIPTSQIVELAIKHVVAGNTIAEFEYELYDTCNLQHNHNHGHLHIHS